MIDPNETEAAHLFVRLIGCGEARYDPSGIVLFKTVNAEEEEAVLNEFGIRCREDRAFMETAFKVLNGALVFAQKAREAAGGDLTSDMMAADLLAQRDGEDDAS